MLIMMFFYTTLVRINVRVCHRGFLKNDILVQEHFKEVLKLKINSRKLFKYVFHGAS